MWALAMALCPPAVSQPAHSVFWGVVWSAEAFREHNTALLCSGIATPSTCGGLAILSIRARIAPSPQSVTPTPYAGCYAIRLNASSLQDKITWTRGKCTRMPSFLRALAAKSSAAV